ncbi:arylsulfatase J [Eurytemora carolleeae]|uniref:arylsulfatase J n=1 Tax=Eurytemora carolleeae TaxID=1294199 RepID=UPI000C7617E2|nr:arylsulfatase J [Eurytemora carolleeae]|eukprot:XP_023324785.1 arylsulfatase J-like [Eurytemora affinis]
MYSTEMYSTEARTIIQKHNPNTPMFLYVPFMALHTPHVGRPPKKLRSLLGRRKKKNKDDLDYFDAEGFGHEEEMRDAVLVAVDQAVHEIISELKSSGLYENSVILVTTDNGGGPPRTNSPLTGGKESLYEGGIRGASFLLSPLLTNPGTKYKGLKGILRTQLFSSSHFLMFTVKTADKNVHSIIFIFT